MGDIIKFKLDVTLESVEFAGCGHINYASKQFLADRRTDGKEFFCLICKRANRYDVPERDFPSKEPTMTAKIFNFIKGSKQDD